MEKIILDASVVIKWFTKEQDSDKAIVYLKSFYNNEVTILAPSLLFYELGNILINKRSSKNKIAEVKKKLQDLQLEIKDIGLEWFGKIYENSLDYSLSFYDSAYVTLMQNKNCKFITADKKLYDKVKNKFTYIKLL